MPLPLLVGTYIFGDHSSELHKAPTGSTHSFIQVITAFTYRKPLFINCLICLDPGLQPGNIRIQTLHIGILIHLPEQTFSAGVFLPYFFIRHYFTRNITTLHAGMVNAIFPFSIL